MRPVPILLLLSAVMLAAVPLSAAPRPAPDFTLDRLEGGEPIRLADLRGRRAVVLLFWAPW